MGEEGGNDTQEVQKNKLTFQVVQITGQSKELGECEGDDWLLRNLFKKLKNWLQVYRYCKANLSSSTGRQTSGKGMQAVAGLRSPRGRRG